MRKIRLISVILVFVLSCSLLTGCVGEVADIKLNADGTGVIDMQFGFTETALETLVSMGTDSKEIENYKPFVYDGITYYGERVTESFNSIEEFNNLMNGEVQSEIDENITEGIEPGSFNLSKTEDGRFVFTLNTFVEESETLNSDDFTEEEWATILEDMRLVFNIRFPSNIIQTQGFKEGVTVKGCTLQLDLLEIGNHLKENTTFEFVSYLPKEIVFMDVKESHWGRNAIYSLAYGGLVAGVSANQFNPEGTLTRAEFYTILARAVGLNTYEENDFWAYGAIKSCISEGLVIDMLDVMNDENIEVNISNWTVPIYREEAVSAIVLASQKVDIDFKKDNQSLTLVDIPDNFEISEEYKNYVVDAFNMGVTSGVDENHTFKPLNTLTRVQICQLLYNLNWCSAPV